MNGLSEMVDDELPPPLEDVTNALWMQRLLATLKSVAPPSTRLTIAADAQAKNINVPQMNLDQSSNKTKSPSPPKDSSQETGFAKGFLLSAQSNKKGMTKSPFSTTPLTASSSKDTELPFLQAGGGDQSSKLALKEVQEAMNQHKHMNPSDWLNDNLMDKIRDNPEMLKCLDDPQFNAAIAELSSPDMTAVTRAWTKWSKARPDFVKSLQGFCALLGDHHQRISAQAQVTANVAKLPVHEQDLVKRVLSDAKVQDALKDPEIQRLLQTPSLLERAMSSGNPDLQAKLQCLVRVGLLQMQ